MHRNKLVYLSDGLAVMHDGHDVILKTKTQTIYLDKEALLNFKRWLDMVRNELI